jgi:hypothetical protein
MLTNKLASFGACDRKPLRYQALYSRDKVIESLNRSEAYRRFGPVTVLAKPVTSWSGLTTYLLKEPMSQARYGAPFVALPARCLSARGMGTAPSHLAS